MPRHESSDSNSSGTHRSWCFTLNNPRNNQLPIDFHADYCIWQLERGSNGTPHLQGFCYFKHAIRLAKLKRLSREAHWEKARGNVRQNIAYCSKSSTRVNPEQVPWTYGEEPSQGKRTDLVGLQKDLDNKMPILEIAQSHFGSFLRYEKQILSYRSLILPPRNSKTIVTVIFGPTGSGKSYSIRHKYPDAYWVSRPPGKDQPLWFDGYDGQDTVVFDEFYGWLPWDSLLRICDETPWKAPIKGGFVQFAPKRIFFTSNLSCLNWYPKISSGQFPAFYRRIEIVFHKLSRTSYYLLKNLQNIRDPPLVRSDSLPVELNETYYEKNYPVDFNP